MANISDADRARRSEQMKAMAAAKKAKAAQDKINPPVESEPEVVTPKAALPARKRKSAFNGLNAKLGVIGEIPGYHMHIFNDQGGRISMALNTGYTFVEKGEVDLAMTDYTVNDNADLGNRISFHADRGDTSTGGAFRAYLMKIPKEYHEEDQKEIQDKITRQEKEMIQNQGRAAGLSPLHTYTDRLGGLQIQHNFKD